MVGDKVREIGASQTTYTIGFYANYRREHIREFQAG